MLKISSIGHNEAFHSIPLQILPHFDVNNIAVAQKLTKWFNLSVHMLWLVLVGLRDLILGK